MGPIVGRMQPGAAPYVHSCTDTLLAAVVSVLYSGPGLCGGDVRDGATSAYVGNPVGIWVSNLGVMFVNDV